MTPEQVRHEIREYVQKDINFLKYAVTGHSAATMQFIEFSPRVQQVIVEEGHRAGLTVQTHTTSGEGLYLAVQAGVDLLQHADITGPQPIPEETVTLIAERGVACAFLANTTKALAWYGERVRAEPLFQSFVTADRNERALMSAGAVVLLSTDAGVFGSELLKSCWWKERWPSEECLLELGEGHFHWLLAMEQKGMKPMDALMAATRNIARAYKVDKELGTLEAGKIADLLILNRNPLEGAANYRSIDLVMKEGRVIDRDSLPTHKLLTSTQSADMSIDATPRAESVGYGELYPFTTTWPPCCRVRRH
jgi:imidazolonepropionase-like amidohydrolase